MAKLRQKIVKKTKALQLFRHKPKKSLARLEGFEPPTHGLEVRSSIHLSYRRINLSLLFYRVFVNVNFQSRPAKDVKILTSSTPSTLSLSFVPNLTEMER